jgi:hypothetical protein
MRKLLTIVLAAVISCVAASPAIAGELEDDLVAVNATLTGQWAGATVNQVIATGNLVEIPVAINYTRFSKDGLNYASWSARGLSLAYYLGSGRYRIEQWSFEGNPGAIEYQVLRVSPPDAKGNWTVDEVIFWPQDDGTFIAWPQTWSMTDGVLAVTREAPPPGLFPPSETTWRGYTLRRN